MYNRDIRILFVTLHCPFGASYGAKVRVLNIGRLLNRIGKVSLVIVRPFPVDEESLNRTNRVGAEWFIRNVWPLIKREAPDIKLRLIGKGSNENCPSMGPDIDGLGYVEDPTEEVATWSAMIVPVTVGGGTRVKIAEAFSRKCPIVSTTLGAFGYQVINGEDLLLADSPQDFASACVLLVNNRELGSKISGNAWKKFLKNWTWDSIGTSVSMAVRECLNRNNYEQHFSIS